ncbi:efflux RND transporter permease subunit [Sulfurospirillum arsenophilum]|uniref:efflux RND transporter permease subunit n=1 Tax=Sulfurospirillum arsenophilum TaxID=56698 RepID=UPI0005A7359D|nr:multidrug efflux RND transporter permease subunit [Sulfurospirillum arsenophilum]
MFSKFFINRPNFAIVISLIIVIAGIMAIRTLPVQEYPDIVPPQIIVSTTYAGADAVTLENTVASVLEEKINGVDNMLYMMSTTSPSGLLTMNLYFEVGTDMNQAKLDVNNRVRLAESKLPDAVKRQGIEVAERSSDVLRILALTSHENRYSTTYMANYAINNILEEFKRIPGISEAIVIGNQEYAIRVWIDPQKLSFYNITTTEVINAIKAQNEQYPMGQIGQEPVQKNIAFTYTVSSTGRLNTPEEFEKILVKSNPDGSSLKLGDVAEIELGAERYFFKGIFNKQPTSMIRITLTSKANALEVSELLDKKIDELKKSFPEGLKIDATYDPTQFVRASIKEVIETLLEAVVLVVFVVYLFLGNIRATIIPVLAIPVSIIGTFAGFYATGFSINLLTLFGLTLAIGLVVDDAIIVIENVERILRKEALSVKEATIKAMQEITAPVLAIVLVLSAVFIPSAFMGGLSGTMSRQFAITIVISVAISGLVALTLTPALCSLLLKHEEEEPIWIIRKFNAFFDYITHHFGQIVQTTIRYSLFNLLIFAIIIFAITKLLHTIPSGLVPKEDKGTFFAVSTLPPGSSLSRTHEVNEFVSEVSLKHPLVTLVGGFSGSDFSSKAYTTDAAYSYVRLADWSKRTGENQNIDAVAKEVMAELSKNKEARIMPVGSSTIIGLGVAGGFEMYVQNKTSGNYLQLESYAKEIVARASERKELRAVRSTLSSNTPQYRLEVDHQKAKAYGIDIADIYATIQTTFGSMYVNDINIFGRNYRVNVQAKGDFREDTKNYRDIFIRSNDGNSISLSDLITLKRVINPNITKRFNMFPSAQILGETNMGYSSGEGLKIMEEIAAEVLPEGYSIAWGGASLQEKKLLETGNLSFIFAIIFIFLILVALYESWMIPWAIVLAVPFSFLGAELSVWLRGLQNDIYFQIGLITLVGLSAKNAILMVEFALQKLEEGYTLLDATIEGAKIRFRPIIMTSFAFIAGTLPLALSSGAGANSRHVIGTTVVGGMITLTLIGVFFTPLFFYLIMRLKEKISLTFKS